MIFTKEDFSVYNIQTVFFNFFINLHSFKHNKQKLMAHCTFSIPFTQPVDRMVLNVKNAIQNVGNATFVGDTTSGSISIPSPLGIIKGTYKISGSVAEFSIQEKPMLVPCSMIESKLAHYLNSTN
jgi:hypothetical protein